MSTLRGDAPCTECGTTDNLAWHTEDVFWNSVVRQRDDGFNGYFVSRWGLDPILCLPCFVKVAEERGYRPTSWRVTPVWPIRREERRGECCSCGWESDSHCQSEHLPAGMNCSACGRTA